MSYQKTCQQWTQSRWTSGFSPTTRKRTKETWKHPNDRVLTLNHSEGVRFPPATFIVKEKVTRTYILNVTPPQKTNIRYWNSYTQMAHLLQTQAKCLFFPVSRVINIFFVLPFLLRQSCRCRREEKQEEVTKEDSPLGCLAEPCWVCCFFSSSLSLSPPQSVIRATETSDGSYTQQTLPLPASGRATATLHHPRRSSAVRRRVDAGSGVTFFFYFTK